MRGTPVPADKAPCRQPAVWRHPAHLAGRARPSPPARVCRTGGWRFSGPAKRSASRTRPWRDGAMTDGAAVTAPAAAGTREWPADCSGPFTGAVSTVRAKWESFVAEPHRPAPQSTCSANNAPCSRRRNEPRRYRRRRADFDDTETDAAAEHRTPTGRIAEVVELHGGTAR